jgi:two-component system phosphate regulon sensor histidine kinase PhoR
MGRYMLVKERDDERRQREQTEKMLHVLSQAIGGIVHDLGNPLTAVQSGAETLRDFVESGDADKELVLEFTEIITDGAQMLNYLRLSLMEQTRVLEGKPIPVERKKVLLRPIIEAGARYQKPKFSSGRAVVLKGDEIEVCVDEIKMITVLMNLIGNALKYSDGEVEINWRVDGNSFFVAILDQGRAGRGISQAQAAQLFVPFGRLDTHAEIEGTGLGLLSVQKIIEAHDGTIHVEGFRDGTAHSAPFQTAPFALPTPLTSNFRTAFVIACPLQLAPSLYSASDHETDYEAR